MAAASTHDGYGTISQGKRLLSRLYAFKNAEKSSEELPMLPNVHTEHQSHTADAGAQLSWSGLSVETVGQNRSFSSRVLLNEVRGAVQPGQILAVMGTSGAGKTTLLNALAGYSNKRQVNVKGTVSINGIATIAEERTSTNIIGYAEQVEPFFGRITPREHLLFEVHALVARRKRYHFVSGYAENVLVDLHRRRTSSADRGDHQSLSSGRMRLDDHCELIRR